MENVDRETLAKLHRETAETLALEGQDGAAEFHVRAAERNRAEARAERSEGARISEGFNLREGI